MRTGLVPNKPGSRWSALAGSLARGVAPPAAVSVFALCACTEPEAPCSAIGYIPGRITVVDVRGEPVPNAKVTISIDGRPAEDARCGSQGAAGGCAAWELGRIGANTIRATRADGTSAVEQTVVVPNVGTVACEVPVYRDVEIVLPDWARAVPPAPRSSRPNFL